MPLPLKLNSAPSLRHVRGREASGLLDDVIAGIILSILLVPQAMAYAQLAGLSPQAGLLSALVPPLLYLVFGTSSYVSVGPVATVSLIIAQAVSNVEADPLTSAAIVAIEAGALLFLLGVTGMGRLVNFISEPVLLGFTAAIAVLICASQLPTLLGFEADSSVTLPGALGGIIGGLDRIAMDAMMIGIAALAGFVAVNLFGEQLARAAGLEGRWKRAAARSLPLAIIVVCCLIVAQTGMDVPLVAQPDGAIPSPALPSPDPALWLSMLPTALTVAVVVFATAIAVAKSLAGSERAALDTGREAMALGAGNIASALTGGYAVGASLSRSALVCESGARSPLASVIASLCILAVILFASGVLVFLSEAVLAALVISAVFGLVKIDEMRGVWRHNRIEGALIAVSFAATLAFGVQLGLAIGAGAGLAHYLWFSSLPRVTRIGTDDEGRSYRSIDRKNVELETLPTLVLRIDRSIYFANASYVEDELSKLVARHEDATCIVLDMRAVNMVDASGAAMLERLTRRFANAGFEVQMAALHEPVRQSIAGLEGDPCRFQRTVGAALEHCGTAPT